jgi:hypothetical protein
VFNGSYIEDVISLVQDLLKTDRTFGLARRTVWTGTSTVAFDDVKVWLKSEK